MKLSRSVPPGVLWASHQQVELVGEQCLDLLLAQPSFSQALNSHKVAKTINSSCSVFCPNGGTRTSGAMNPATEKILRSSCAS